MLIRFRLMHRTDVNIAVSNLIVIETWPQAIESIIIIQGTIENTFEILE